MPGFDDDDDFLAPRDPFDEAEAVLRRAAAARGLDPDEVELPRHRPGDRPDPLDAAQEALERAARIREQVTSGRSSAAEERARAQLRRLKEALGQEADDAPDAPPTDAPDGPEPLIPRKRRL